MLSQGRIRTKTKAGGEQESVRGDIRLNLELNFMRTNRTANRLDFMSPLRLHPHFFATIHLFVFGTSNDQRSKQKWHYPSVSSWSSWDSHCAETWLMTVNYSYFICWCKFTKRKVHLPDKPSVSLPLLVRLLSLKSSRNSWQSAVWFLIFVHFL